MVDDSFIKGKLFFNQGNYFEAHEAWEDLWFTSFGERKSYLQGLIQTAVALHKAKINNVSGALKLLVSARNYLQRGINSAEPGEADPLKTIKYIDEFYNSLTTIPEGENFPLPYFKLPLINQNIK